MHLNRKDKLATCQNCFYSDSICAFSDANKYCIQCLCDHACCLECNSGYHVITMVEYNPIKLKNALAQESSWE
jgi:hypothetical protein